MLNENASGVYTIAVTPFLPDGALDLPSLERVTDFYLEKGATGLTVLGIMCEAGKMSAEESLTVVRRVVGRAGVPVVVGVSVPGFAAMQPLGHEAMAAGTAAGNAGMTGPVFPVQGDLLSVFFPSSSRLA